MCEQCTLKKLDIYYSQHETVPQAYIQVCNKQSINISLMWADWYFKHTLQLKFQNNIKSKCIQAETLKIVVNTKYCNSVGELIREFLLCKVGGTCTVNNICWLLGGITYSFEVSDSYVTETLRVIATYFMDCCWYYNPAKQWTHCSSKLNSLKPQIKLILKYWIVGPGAFATIFHTIGMALVVSYILKHQWGHMKICHRLLLACRPLGDHHWTG